MQVLTTIAVLATLLSAFALYAVNYETRGLAEDVRKREQIIDRAHRDIAILKAERAHLARPERIGEHARRLGLMPATADQFTAYPNPDPLQSPSGR
ncbi:MAG: cell division protein FtsL [Alphaproteobacteria bacterium]|nr:cell division protein FtsL [Alphaproteobacteria bacterium]